MSIRKGHSSIFNLPGNLVSQGLGGDNGDFFADTLVGMEIRSQAGVVFLNDDLGGLLDSLGSYTTLLVVKIHFDLHPFRGKHRRPAMIVNGREEENKEN